MHRMIYRNPSLQDEERNKGLSAPVPAHLFEYMEAVCFPPVRSSSRTTGPCVAALQHSASSTRTNHSTSLLQHSASEKKDHPDRYSAVEQNNEIQFHRSNFCRDKHGHLGRMSDSANLTQSRIENAAFESALA